MVMQAQDLTTFPGVDWYRIGYGLIAPLIGYTTPSLRAIRDPNTGAVWLTDGFRYAGVPDPQTWQALVDAGIAPPFESTVQMPNAGAYLANLQPVGSVVDLIRPQPTLEREALQQRQREFERTFPLQQAEVTGFVPSPERQEWSRRVANWANIEFDFVVNQVRSGAMTPEAGIQRLASQGLIPQGTHPNVLTHGEGTEALRQTVLSRATSGQSEWANTLFGPPPRETPTLAAQQFAAQVLANPANVLAAPYVARNILGANVPNNVFLTMPAVQAVASGSTAPLRGQGVPLSAQAGQVLPSGDALPNLTPQSFGRQVYGALSPVEREITTRLGAANTGLYPEDFTRRMAEAFIPGAASGMTVYG